MKLAPFKLPVNFVTEVPIGLNPSPAFHPEVEEASIELVKIKCLSQSVEVVDKSSKSDKLAI